MEQILKIPGAKTLRLQNQLNFSGFAGSVIMRLTFATYYFENK